MSIHNYEKKLEECVKALSNPELYAHDTVLKRMDHGIWGRVHSESCRACKLLDDWSDIIESAKKGGYTTPLPVPEQQRQKTIQQDLQASKPEAIVEQDTLHCRQDSPLSQRRPGCHTRPPLP